MLDKTSIKYTAFLLWHSVPHNPRSRRPLCRCDNSLRSRSEHGAKQCLWSW